MNNTTLNQLTIPNNHTDVDLKKVSYANFFYRNQEGLELRLLPKGPSVRGIVLDDKELAAEHWQYPMETVLERAKRLDIIDVWEPVIVLQLTNGHRLIYTGDKAISINRTWKARVYGNK